MSSCGPSKCVLVTSLAMATTRAAATDNRICLMCVFLLDYTGHRITQRGGSEKLNTSSLGRVACLMWFGSICKWESCFEC